MYPHYRSKEELLYAIALEGHSSLLAALRRADDPAATFTERLHAVVSRSRAGTPRTTSKPASCSTNCTA